MCTALDHRLSYAPMQVSCPACDRNVTLAPRHLKPLPCVPHCIRWYKYIISICTSDVYESNHDNSGCTAMYGCRVSSGCTASASPSESSLARMPADLLSLSPFSALGVGLASKAQKLFRPTAPQPISPNKPSGTLFELATYLN